MALTTAQIQNAYVAFFNRPADVAGLNYWSAYTGTLADLYNTFAQSSEYTGLFTSLNNTQKVNAIYTNLLGRTPDVAGLNYWVLQLDQGKVTTANLALAIVNGAQGTDATAITNKVSAATTFTAALDTAAEVLNYASANSTGLAAVKAWLAAVTDSATTLATQTGASAIDTLNTTLANNTTANAGQTYTLTTGVDSFTGGAGNDSFVASDSTYTGLDVIDGGAGTDTLTISDTKGTVVFSNATVSNVEKLVYTSVAGFAGNAADFSGNSALTNVTLNLQALPADSTVKVSDTAALTVSASGAWKVDTTGGSSLTATVANAFTHKGAATTTASITGATTVGVTDSSAKGDKLTTLTVSGNTGALTTTTTNALTTVSLTNTTQAATIGNATASHTLNLGLNKVTGAAAITDAAATTVAITTSGAASAVALTTTKATTLTATNAVGLDISGSADIATVSKATVTGAGAFTATDFGTKAAAAAVLDLSGTSGANTVTLAVGQTYTGGSGVDTVTVTAPTKAVAGGTGTDVIVVNAATYATNALVTGFETLAMGAAANGGFDATGFTGVSVNAAITGTSKFTSVAAGATFAVTVAPGQDVWYALADASGKSDSVAVTLSTATTAGLDFSGKNIDLSGIESVSVSSLGTAVNKVTLVDTSATSLTITGAAGLTATLAGATGLTKVDASASTGAIDVSAVAVSASGATILGSATKASVLKGGAGADTITGGTAADTITGGTGLNVLTGGGGNDTFVIANPSSVNTYSTITDANKGDILSFTDKGTETFGTTKITLAGTASFSDYANAVVAAGGDASTNGYFGWFQFGGDTYLVESQHNGVTVTTYQDGIDSIVKLTGLVDLSTATGAGTNILTVG